MARRRNGEPQRPSAEVPPVPPTRRESVSEAPVQAARWVRWFRPMWFALAVLAALTIYVVGTRLGRTDRMEGLPALPDLSQQSPAIRAHVTEADRAARARPTSAADVAALCTAYHADMFYEQAQQCYGVVEVLDVASWKWTYYRALAYGELGDSERLADGLRRVTAAAPDFSPAWWRLGEVEFKARQFERAAEAWQRAASLPDPERPATASGSAPAPTPMASIAAYSTLGLARIALMQGNAEGARAQLEDVTAGAPRFGPAFRLLGDAYSALNRPDDAARAVRIADRSPTYDPYVDPTMDALVQESRSSTFLLQQASSTDVSTNAARREYLIRRAIEMDPANSDASYELATLLRALKRYAEALEQLERYRALVPDDTQVYADMGRCLSGLGRFGEAERALRRALEDLDDAGTRYDLALVLDRSGRLAEAVAEYERALDRNPNQRDALNNLGIAFVRQGKLDRAAGLFERLVSIDPSNADAYTNLGVVLLTQGAREPAAQAFRAALELSPNHALAREGLRKLEP